MKMSTSLIFDYNKLKAFVETTLDNQLGLTLYFSSTRLDLKATENLIPLVLIYASTFKFVLDIQ